jgi:hypothetical protein
MAAKFLYQIVPTKNVSSVVEAGFVPRAGIRNGVKYSPRVWFYTDLNMAHFVAWWWFHDVLTDAEKRINRDLVHHWVNGRDIGWRWNGTEWLAVSLNQFSIVQVERDRVRCFPAELPFELPPQFRRTLVWTPNHVAPPSIVRKLDREVFFSARFEQFMAHIPSVRAALKERPVIREGGKVDWLKGRQGRLPHHK